MGTTGATEVLTICIEADGKTVINEGTYTGTYKPVAGADFTVAEYLMTDFRISF